MVLIREAVVAVVVVEQSGWLQKFFPVLVAPFMQMVVVVVVVPVLVVELVEMVLFAWNPILLQVGQSVIQARATRGQPPAMSLSPTTRP